MGGGALIVLGSLLPWLNIPLVGSVSAIQGDGIITLLVGLVVVGAGVLAGLGLAPTTMNFSGLVAALGAAGIAIFKIATLAGSFDDSPIQPMLGPGLPVILIGGLVAAVAGLVGALRAVQYRP